MEEARQAELLVDGQLEHQEMLANDTLSRQGGGVSQAESTVAGTPSRSSFGLPTGDAGAGAELTIGTPEYIANVQAQSDAILSKYPAAVQRQLKAGFSRDVQAHHFALASQDLKQRSAQIQRQVPLWIDQIVASGEGWQDKYQVGRSNIVNVTSEAYGKQMDAMIAKAVDSHAIETQIRMVL